MKDKIEHPLSGMIRDLRDLPTKKPAVITFTYKVRLLSHDRPVELEGTAHHNDENMFTIYVRGEVMAGFSMSDFSFFTREVLADDEE